jgi:hypothetical protein
MSRHRHKHTKVYKEGRRRPQVAYPAGKPLLKWS